MEGDDSELEQDSIVSIKPAPPPPPYCTGKIPIWSLGVILLWQLLEVEKLWPNLNTAQTIRKILVVANSSASNVAERIAKEHGINLDTVAAKHDTKDFTLLKRSVHLFQFSCKTLIFC